jgi:cytochrome c556
MKTTIIFCLSMALLPLSAGTFAQEGPIKYRKGVMKAVGGHATGIAQITHGGVGHSAHLATHTDGLQALSKMIVTAFKEDAKPTEDVTTRAKPDIWQNWSDFEAKAEDLVKATAAYAATARTGDKDMTVAKLEGVWDACKGCHKKYRKKKD